MLRKLEVEGLQADLAAVDALLADLQPQDDPIGHRQFAHRRREIQTALDQLGQAPEESGKVALFFGGRPVWGSRGIDVDFATKALESFQKAVAAQVAAEGGPVGSRGRLPQELAPRLMLTDVARGSFGFVLEEAADNEPLVEASTKMALRRVTALMRGAGSTDEQEFERALEGAETRSLKAIGDFFREMQESGAQVRLVEGDQEITLDAAAVERARQRTEHVQINDRTLDDDGTLIGLVPARKSFEWRRGTGEEIVGSVHAEVATAYENSLFGGSPLVGRPLRGRFRVLTVSRPDGKRRTVYTLLNVVEPPENLPNTMPTQLNV